MANNRLNKVCITSLDYADMYDDNVLSDGEMILMNANLPDMNADYGDIFSPVLKIGPGPRKTMDDDDDKFYFKNHETIGYPISKIPIYREFSYDPNDITYLFDSGAREVAMSGTNNFLFNSNSIVTTSISSKYNKFAYAGSLLDFGIMRPEGDVNNDRVSQFKKKDKFQYYS